MIPLLSPQRDLPAHYAAYLEELRAHGFEGEIQTDYATRLTAATDNSVYQLLPLGVLFPHHVEDVKVALRVLADPRFREVRLSPRGGGTGTNGQSLCDGLMLDVSRHLRSILEVNLEEGWVRVQPGVVLDELNRHLAPHGRFFAPTLSPSNRATLGGMISTDASGKGSRVYGKTSEHVLALETVLWGGQLLQTKRLSPPELNRELERKDSIGALYREINDICERSKERIEAELPKLRRFLTGYDLAHVKDEQGFFDLSRVFAGSEGTLGVLTEAKLRILPIVTEKRLLAIRYASFDAALRAAARLAETQPSAIETIDQLIVSLAKSDVIWHSVGHLLDDTGETPLAAVNLVEFEGPDAEFVDGKVRKLIELLDSERGQEGRSTGYTLATDKKDQLALWSLRKKGVGLLGNVSGERRPVPFVEDTVVPPEHLADYIQEFRAVLDAHGLRYGMFGHVDVGCLHVRPALNLRDPEDEKRLAQISDQVVALVKKYGGVLWGEHGRGYRSNYTPTFFGPELYAEMRRVKGAFDPHNQLNPGKLATPPSSNDSLVQVRGTTRGSFDRQIPEEVRAHFHTSIHCNGNGACFDWNPDSVMCPSSKVTKDRIHSPKGRAGILREWLRLTTQAGGELLTGGETPAPIEFVHGRSESKDDFSHEVYDAMDGCLACKACATDCPIKVDVPNLRAEFLENYHTRYRRPLKDYFTALLEWMIHFFAIWPKLSNLIIQSAPSRALLRFIGIVDTPALGTERLEAKLRERGAESYDRTTLARLSPEEKARTVLIVQDTFTSYFEPNVALATFDLLRALDYRPIFLPFQVNGKALHVKGFLSWFRRRAARTAAFLKEAASFGVPLVGIEPAVTLTYRDEYQHLKLAEMAGVKVELLQEFLARELKVRPQPLLETRSAEARYRLFGHCTERTMAPKSAALWQEVFRGLGHTLDVETTGCCGMCGVFGHEASHYEESRGIFEMSWQQKLPTEGPEQRKVLATGHSCRSQVKRFGGFLPKHPAEVLASFLAEQGKAAGTSLH